jgi:hypothetical protein
MQSINASGRISHSFIPPAGTCSKAPAEARRSRGAFLQEWHPF